MCTFYTYAGWSSQRSCPRTASQSQPSSFARAESMRLRQVKRVTIEIIFRIFLVYAGIARPMSNGFETGTRSRKICSLTYISTALPPPTNSSTHLCISPVCMRASILRILASTRLHLLRSCLLVRMNIDDHRYSSSLHALLIGRTGGQRQSGNRH